MRLARHRPARRLHDVQHVDARERIARARTAHARARCCQPRGQPGARARAAPGPGASWGRRCDARRARSSRRTSASATATAAGSLADALMARLRAARPARERAAARHRGLRRQAPPAHRPAADALGGPAARRDRRRPAERDRSPPRSEAAARSGRGLVTLERASLAAPPTPDAGDGCKLTVYLGRGGARRRPPGARRARRRAAPPRRRRARASCWASTAPRTGARRRARFAGANAARAADGRRRRRRRARSRAALPELDTLLGEPLRTLERVASASATACGSPRRTTSPDPAPACGSSSP